VVVSLQVIAYQMIISIGRSKLTSYTKTKMKICATLLLTKKNFCASEKFLQKTLDKTG
jgi:hypothetical protein